MFHYIIDEIQHSKLYILINVLELYKFPRAALNKVRQVGQHHRNVCSHSSGG